MDLDEWADQYRYLNRTTGEKWQTSRMEVARGVMKAVTEAGVRTITIMSSTQMMKTEVLLNTIGYFSHMDPCPILVVQPKKELAQKFSHVRLKQMIDSTPELAEAYKGVNNGLRKSSNSALYKDFRGGQVAIVSAKVPSDLAMLAIRVVLLDEIDKYDESVGKEGDPVDLAEERTSKYATNSLSIRTCSPTVKDISRIEASYELSDKRKPFVACPHCNHLQILKWPNVKWDKNKLGEPIPDTARYLCSGCSTLWNELDRLRAIRNVTWRQMANFECGQCGHSNRPEMWDPNDQSHWDGVFAKCENCGAKSCKNSHAGFWASKLYGSFRPLSDLVQKWADAQGNIEKLRAFINTQLAETFEESGDSIRDYSWLMDRAEKYEAELPKGVGAITAGVDIQNDRIEIEVVGWGKDEESWSLDYKIIACDPSDPDTWDQLDTYLNRPWHLLDGRCTYIAAACIDMNGGYAEEVARFCKTRTNRRFWPIRGMGGDGQSRPIWPHNASRGSKYKIPFYNIGVDSAKNTVFARLVLPEGSAGMCHFPVGRDPSYYQQLVAEKRVTKWRGARKILVWDNPKRARNEAFDCRVYAYSALCGLIHSGLDLNEAVQRMNLFFAEPIKPKARDLEEKASIEKSKPIKSQRQRIVKSSFIGK